MPHKDPEARRAYDRAYLAKNKERVQNNQRTWAERNADRKRGQALAYIRRNPERVRFARIKTRYGLTEDQYWAMLDRQGGCCAACRDPFDKTPHVDHCHKTLRVRGLLCGHCNRAIGYLRDSEETAFRIAAYLTASRLEGVFA